MTDGSIATARAVYEAYAKKDRAAIEALIAADLHFTSPLDNRINRGTYFARCWPNSKTLASYEARTTNGSHFRNTEILTVRQRRVVEVEVYFGWSIPHDAAPGSFVDEDDRGEPRRRREG